MAIFRNSFVARGSRTVLILLAIVLAACSETSVVEPGPGTDDQTTTTEPTELETAGQDDDEEDDDIVTADDSPTTTADVAGDSGDADDDGELTSDAASTAPATTVVIDESSENAGAFTELAGSGLVLTLDEQSCADDAAESASADGADSLDAIVAAVQTCASPQAIDEFASGLIEAGGAPLPPTESACVSFQLQETEEFRPFWRALLDDDPFDFLLADNEVQNRYLDLYAECVSVGRAVAEQAAVELSGPTRDCIDDIYNDREFVRVTIEADLSGDPEERARIDSQIASCLTSEELALVGQ